MTPVSIHRDLPRAQYLAERAFATLDRFLHIEADSGVILLVVAAFAPIWANSPFAHRCQNLWHLPRSVRLDDFLYSQSLHFWINDDVGNSPARLPPSLQQKERPS